MSAFSRKRQVGIPAQGDLLAIIVLLEQAEADSPRDGF